MLQEKITSLLEKQVTQEFYSAYLYPHISNHYFARNLNGFGDWFKIQAREERDHALLFLTYLQNNGEAPRLGAIAAPRARFSDFEAPLAAALSHERHVTSLINAIYAGAMGQNDFRTVQFLDWFVKEQGGEEKNTDDLINRYRLFAGDGKGLYMLDSELAARTYVAPDLIL